MESLSRDATSRERRAGRVRAVRRWVRRTQAAHAERGETLGNFYFARAVRR